MPWPADGGPPLAKMSFYIFVKQCDNHPRAGNRPLGTARGKVMHAWTDWMVSLGDAIVDGGNPVGLSKTVMPGGGIADNGGANPASGYSLIDAADMDDALAKAKGCPILDAGGSIEVAETIDM